MTTPLRGICDTHVHVYDQKYPTSTTSVLRPPDACLAEYAVEQARLGIERVVFVQPTTYGLDNRCQLAAADELGDGSRVVVVVDQTVSDDELERLGERGARGARFHLLPGGAVSEDIMRAVADRVAGHGWHLQLQMNGCDLPARLEQLLALPTPLVIDHVGRFMPPVATDDTAFAALLRLIDTGRCWVKLSAPYESTLAGAPRYPTVTALAHRLVEHAPERMLWATNWPHPCQDHPPTSADLLALRDEWLPTDAHRRQILVDNPAEVYDFDPILQETP